MIAKAYLSREHYNDREGSCPLVALPSDVARSGKAVKAAFRQVLDKLVEVFSRNLAAPRPHESAQALVAMCVGAMVIARAVDNPELAQDFLEAAHRHLLTITGWSTLEAEAAA